MSSVSKILEKKDVLLQIFESYDHKNANLIKLTRFLQILELQQINIKDEMFCSILGVSYL